MLKFYKPVPVKFMEILKFILKMKNIMEMLIQLAQDHVMMKEKDALKHYLWIITENTILKIKIIRIFNTYGPNMANNDGRVISNFILQAIKGKN